jgi:hypothetical protein
MSTPPRASELLETDCAASLNIRDTIDQLKERFIAESLNERTTALPSK